MFVTRLSKNGISMCTDWVRRIWSTEIGARADLLDMEDNGPAVVLAGGFGGAAFTVENGATTSDVDANGFILEFGSDGSLSDQDTFGVVPGDVVHGVARFVGGYIVTGALRHETPSCNGCNGDTHVSDPALQCSVGGPRGMGGMGGTLGTGGMGGSGGAATGPDSNNAALWTRDEGDVNCANFNSYGADTSGAADAQSGRHAATQVRNGACITYWTGVSGSSAWPYLQSDPTTSLADAGDMTADGFLWRLVGPGSGDCGVLGEHRFNARLTPEAPGTAAWGKRVEPRICDEGGVLQTGFVNGAATTLLSRRCDDSGDCDLDLANLPGSAQQMFIADYRPTLELRWSAAFGPVEGTILDDLSVDTRDFSYTMFTTTGSLQLANINANAAASCDELAEGAPAGTFVVALDRDGQGTRANCLWAQRLGP